MLSQGEKRERVLLNFQNSATGQLMAELRAKSDCVKTPDGPHPETPRDLQSKSKRTWERQFYVYKTVSKEWALWLQEGRAVPKGQSLGSKDTVACEFLTVNSKASAMCTYEYV